MQSKKQIKENAMAGDSGDEFPTVDEAVCIGCGLCALPCPGDAARLKRRTDVTPPETFGELHGCIVEEKRP